MDKLAEYKNDGVITLLLLKKVDDIKDIHAKRKTDYNDRDKFPMLLYEGGISLKNVIDAGGVDLDDLASTYSITSYNRDLDNEKNKLFKEVFQPFVGRAREDVASVAFAILDIIAYADTAIPSPKIFTMLTYVYGKLFNYSSGEFVLLNSHFMASTHYIYHIEKDSGSGDAKYIYDYTIPIDNSIEPGQYESLMDEMLCDFVVNPDNGYVNPDYLPVMILSDMSTYESKITWTYITLLFDDLNLNVFYIFILLLFILFYFIY